MKKRKKIPGLTMLSAAILAIAAHYQWDPWGFYWKVPAQEEVLRQQVIAAAEQYLGCCEADGSHQQIIDAYNAHKPLAMGYQVQYTDSWCATFVSTIAIECKLTQIIPTECGCERQIGLFQNMGHWVENDNLIPLPGDLIYYDWDTTNPGECTGWSDHVGLVVGTKWPFIKVIEGNKDDRVDYRILILGNPHIRGYGKPDYAAMTKSTP